MPETQDILDHWFDGYEPMDRSIDQVINLVKSERGAAAMVQTAMQELALRRAAAGRSAPAADPAQSKSRRVFLAMAAVVVMALLLSAVWHVVRPPEGGAGAVMAGAVLVNESRGYRIPEGATFEVPSGANADLRLSDGSLVNVDAGSRAAVQLAAPQARIVRLMAGAADFDVTPQTREFRVETAIGRVRVLGTKFRVALLPVSMLQVVVRQGKVTVECGRGATTLTVGQQRDFVLLPDGRGGPLIHGIIRSIDLQGHALVLTDPSNGPYRFGAVNVTLNGHPATLDALTTGMIVTCVLSPNEREALEIRAEPHPHD